MAKGDVCASGQVLEGIRLLQHPRCFPHGGILGPTIGTQASNTIYKKDCRGRLSITRMHHCLDYLYRIALCDS